METDAGLVKSPPWPARAAAGMRRAVGAMTDLLYPPTCLGCNLPLAVPDALCPACFSGLKPITAPLCPRLGIPFAASLGAGAVSAEAAADPPPFGRARAAVVYNDGARALVGRLKYGDRPELARFCARMMAGAGHELWTGDAVLVPVPLHRRRLLRRRYNQSAELARALSAVTGLRVEAGAVVRHRETRQQVGLSGDARQRNVAGAFAVEPDRLSRIAGRRLVVVDDVYTTGATAKAVTRALLRAGAAGVDVVTFARVVIGDDLPI